MLIWMNGAGESFLRRRLVSRNQTGATSILRVGRRAMDFVILFAGVLTSFYLLGANLTATLAGLGVGGIAIALAAQKTWKTSSAEFPSSSTWPCAWEIS
jgi:MscS family membrane protein